MEPETPVLAVKGVTKTFAGRDAGELVAVDDVSLRVASGEAVGLVGASGAGKSTVARIVASLVAPDAGRVVFEGRDLARMSRSQLRATRGRMHLVFQDPYASLAPGMDVGELVAEPLVIHEPLDRETRQRRVLAALEEVRLTPSGDYVDRHPHALSGGERQRVALARALILRPRLLLADEPTQMLDAPIRADLVRLLRELQRAHDMAMIYITHDLALASGFCERLLVMYRGRIVEQGPTDRVLAQPDHDHTRALVTAAGRLQPPA